jgi:hypothetical protein
VAALDEASSNLFNVKLQRPARRRLPTTATAERATFDLSSLRQPSRPARPLPSPRLTEDLDRHDGRAQITRFAAEMEVAKGAHRLDGA